MKTTRLIMPTLKKPKNQLQKDKYHLPFADFSCWSYCLPQSPIKGSTLRTVIPVPTLVWMLILEWPTTVQVLYFAKTLSAYSSMLFSEMAYK